MGVGGGFEQKILDKFSEKLGPCTPSMLSNYSFAAHSKTDFTIIFGPRMKSGGTYRIGLVRPSVCVSVCMWRDSSETVHRIVPKLWEKFGIKILRKVCLPDFSKNFPFPGNRGVRGKKWPKLRFLTLSRRTRHYFFLIFFLNDPIKYLYHPQPPCYPAKFLFGVKDHFSIFFLLYKLGNQ